MPAARQQSAAVQSSNTSQTAPSNGVSSTKADPYKFLKKALDIGLWFYLIIVPMRLQFGARSFIGIDSPFHARYATFFFSRIFTRTFPTTAYSIWSQRWGDKEFLFHAYLAPFCVNEDLLQVGAKVAAGILFAAVLCSLAVIMKRQNISGALWWAAILPALSTGWDFRMLMVRSHLASVLLILWILFFFERRRMRPLCILTFIYTWSYTAPYFALLLCGSMAFGRWFIYRVRLGYRALQDPAEGPEQPETAHGSAATATSDRFLLLGCAAATVAGMLIHPQMPNQFLNDWMHLTLVATRAWGVATSPVELGSEFQSETMREAYLLHPGVLACLALAWILVAFIPGNRSRRSCLFLWMTVPTLALYGLSGRFIEYLAPLTIWAFALVIADLRSVPARLLADLSRSIRILLTIGGFASIVGLHVFTLWMINRNIWHPEHDLTQERAGKWLAANAHPGDLVVPLDWTQFPSLYYYAPKQRYVVGLEPTTMQVIYPEKLRYLEEVRLGKRELDMNELRQVFPDAHYVVVWAASGPALARLSHKKYTPVFEDAEDVIFDVRSNVSPN